MMPPAQFILGLLSLFAVVHADDCSSTSFRNVFSSSTFVAVQVENGYTVNYAINSSLARNEVYVTVTGAALITFSDTLNQITVGNPSSSPTTTATSASSRTTTMSPLSSIALFGIASIMLALRSRTAMAVMVMCLAMSYMQMGHSQCSKTVTISVPEGFLQNVRLGTGNTFTCPDEYPLLYKGQCVSYMSTFSKIYSSSSNAAGCDSVLPTTQVLVANSDMVKLDAGSSGFAQWADFSYRSLNLGESATLASFTTPSGIQATFTLYNQYFATNNGHFPVTITTAALSCNATYKCISGSCLEEMDPDPVDYWCNSYNLRDSALTTCTNFMGSPVNVTCAAQQGCSSICSELSGGSVQCSSVCDPTQIPSCGPLYCSCPGRISFGHHLSPSSSFSIFMIVIMVALLFIIH
eukprot:TRINITY_DN3723_c0_g1_i1.p1 TRINITY_DN3723_c0_g1~~TRINITY_DN3723_c0_g1_i1.p1  ORF type:complete len:408 (+),score=67.01 TRINITY_DN3723_c0_g1_i1:3-1226(+)